MQRFDGERVVVTGAARRLGRAIADAFRGAGAHVVITTRSGHESGGAYPEIALDLDDSARLESVMSEAAKLLGGAPTILVNSASRFEWDRLETVNAESFNAHMRTNLLAPVLLTKGFAAGANRPGAVINILDYKLANLNADHLSYTLSKAGLEAFTRMAALALAEKGIRVNGIAPGYTLPAPGQSEEEFARLSPNVPLKRAPTPGDIAEATLYLAAAKAVTGQTLLVDAGAHMMPQDRDFLFW